MYVSGVSRDVTIDVKMRSECVDEAKDDGYDPDRLREVRADLASDGKAWSAAGRQG